MLPVVRGPQETRKQILLYSLVLFGTSLLLVPVASMGLVYVVAAVVLGGWFVWRALRLWRGTSPAESMRLFRFSIVYLASAVRRGRRRRPRSADAYEPRISRTRRSRRANIASSIVEEVRMIGFLLVLFGVVVIGSFPATWLLMLFLGNVGVNVSFWGAPARRDPDDVLRRRDRWPQPLPLGFLSPRLSGKGRASPIAATGPRPRARSPARS